MSMRVVWILRSVPCHSGERTPAKSRPVRLMLLLAQSVLWALSYTEAYWLIRGTPKVA